MIMLYMAAVLLAGAAIGTVFIEREARYALESLGGKGESKALIPYHPSRDAHFSHDLSLGIADGFKAAGYRVDRATLTSTTPNNPRAIDYSLW